MSRKLFVSILIFLGSFVSSADESLSSTILLVTQIKEVLAEKGPEAAASFMDNFINEAGIVVTSFDSRTNNTSDSLHLAHTGRHVVPGWDPFCYNGSPDYSKSAHCRRVFKRFNYNHKKHIKKGTVCKKINGVPKCVFPK